MVMMCTYLTGQLPFKEVYLHTIIRDKEGRKMSKSLGNVVDPMDVRNGITLEDLHERLLEGNLDPAELERAKEGQKRQFPDGIKECGVDALRFALCAFAQPGRDINLDVQRIVGYRNFCNKIYNAVKLVMMQLGDDYKPLAWDAKTKNESTEDLWMLSRLSAAITTTNQCLSAYDFPGATTAVYNLWLYDFANNYLEMIKPVFRGSDAKRQTAVRNVLFKVVDNGLRLLSPFMPFLTEELWQRLPTCRGENDLVDPPSITVAAFPVTGSFSNPKIEALINFVLETVKASRHIKQEYLPASAKPDVYLRPIDEDAYHTLQQFEELMSTLIGATARVLPVGDPVPKGCALEATSDVEVHLMVKGLVDPQQEIEKLEKKLAGVQERLSKIESDEQQETYLTAVPQEVRDANSKKKADLQTQLEVMSTGIKRYQSLLD
ncbi:uncharacterized protein MONBRDRAFT_21048 [Monosiga brevicollis MX1]|uniref:valine--tRNA ligase n=1 Tax=Monosiga brevicollis TaxID=81824 RepID=A9UPZ5_MONBE|nr:uncharacterized protein MONBRDRAFT_21048 [Monosiga brevicollis MX1]EDQ92507.1 predicted protein [Monosiga brevicollis MX1]|eukprot:XP_001742269.1 hypothetical protein [Monosiga brevicollis MX1]